MIRSLALVLLAAPLLADGPRYGHKDRFVQQEFDNVYHDLKYPNISNGSANTFTITGSTITALHVGSLTGFSASSVVKQLVVKLATSQTSTTSTSYVDTALTQSITPTSGSSRILVMAFGTLTSPSDGNNIFATIAKDGSNVLATDGGCRALYSGGGGNLIRVGCAMAQDEHAVNTTARTYSVRIKVGGGTGLWAESGLSSSLILVEYQ